MKQRKKIMYVDNKKFYAAIVEYHKQVQQAHKEGKEEPRISNYIGECIYKIAENLSTKPCFINYSFRDEMISDGIENCILYFKDYNPNYSNGGPATQNPFTYFTQIVYYAFLRRINKEEKNRYTIYSNYQEMITTTDKTLLTDSDGNHLQPHQNYDNINSFMSKFEKKELEKKEKRKQAKQGLQQFYEENHDQVK